MIFGPDASCANGDLDANFGELYGKQAWATTGIGYATGPAAGVTQSTNKATTVVLNKMCSQITMNAASLAAGASIAFVLQNSMIAATDCVVVNRGNGSGTEKAYRVRRPRTYGECGHHRRELQRRRAGRDARAELRRHQAVAS